MIDELVSVIVALIIGFLFCLFSGLLVWACLGPFILVAWLIKKLLGKTDKVINITATNKQGHTITLDNLTSDQYNMVRKSLIKRSYKISKVVKGSKNAKS